MTPTLTDTALADRARERFVLRRCFLDLQELTRSAKGDACTHGDRMDLNTAFVCVQRVTTRRGGSEDVEVKAPMFPKTQIDRSPWWPLAALFVGAVVWVGAVALAINGLRY